MLSYTSLNTGATPFNWHLHTQHHVPVSRPGHFRSTTLSGPPFSNRWRYDNKIAPELGNINDHDAASRHAFAPEILDYATTLKFKEKIGYLVTDNYHANDSCVVKPFSQLFTDLSHHSIKKLKLQRRLHLKGDNNAR